MGRESKRHRNRRRTDREREAAPTEARKWSWKVPTVPVATLLTLWGAVQAYQYTGADELRKQLYQPVYADVLTMERAVKGPGVESRPFPKSLPALVNDGTVERIPMPLRGQLLRVRDDTSKMHTNVMAIAEEVVRGMSAKIMTIRSEAQDKDWIERTRERLRQIDVSRAGKFDMATLTLSHLGRSRGIDVRDPKHYFISDPGGPTMSITEWLTFPNLSELERHWTELDFLYFHETNDTWYYRITREDLSRLNLTLEQFIRPVHEKVKQTPQYLDLSSALPRLVVDCEAVKQEIAERIRQPKMISDLVAREQ